MSSRRAPQAPDDAPEARGPATWNRIAPRIPETARCLVARVHGCVYIRAMKRGEPERRLRDMGWTLRRHGGKHDVWVSADGSFTEFVPRHPEIHERLAQAILKRIKERQ